MYFYIISSVSPDYYDQEKFRDIVSVYLPEYGEGKNMAQQCVTAVCNILDGYYKKHKYYLALPPGYDIFDDIDDKSDLLDDKQIDELYNDIRNDLESNADEKLMSCALWISHINSDLENILYSNKFLNNDGEYEDVLKKLTDYCFDDKWLKKLSTKPKSGSIYSLDYGFDELVDLIMDQYMNNLLD